MLELLKREVCKANLKLVEEGLVVQTWGNASALDKDSGNVVIKPSGVPYESMQPDQMAVVDSEGRLLEGRLKPSVDLATHLVLYEAFPQIGAVVHTHSHFATAFAQARRPIPCFGTTHADYFFGEIPLTEALSEAEVALDYEKHIGDVIVRRYQNLDPMHFPAVLAAGHAPFTWGHSLDKALENAVVLEEVARMAWHTLSLNPDAAPLEDALLKKHFLRKHGDTAYYGQDEKG